MTHKTTTITLETNLVMVVRHSQAAVDWCPECRAAVEVIILFCDGPPDPTTLALFQQWYASGRLHLWQPSQGPTRICVTPLLRCVESEGFCESSSANPILPNQPRRKGI